MTRRRPDQPRESPPPTPADTEVGRFRVGDDTPISAEAAGLRDRRFRVGDDTPITTEAAGLRAGRAPVDAGAGSRLKEEGAVGVTGATNAPGAVARTAVTERRTRETRVEVSLALDGDGATRIATGIGFLDHLLEQVALHGGLDLTVRCDGDLHVDDHHTAEDVALTIGEALDLALGDRAGLARFGWAYAPLEDALARAVVDLATRPFAAVRLALTRERLGELSCENVPHVLRSLAAAGCFTLHVEVLDGDNDHHRAEAAFKALGLALRAAVARRGDRVASTKGVL